ncbi:hypothetical protein H4R19_002105 [Coemansia spiralis]|nr:hypothetical protein H4R19_002105 [Coemansia spiralis]
MDSLAAALGVLAAVLLLCGVQRLARSSRVQLVAATSSGKESGCVRALIEAHCPSLVGAKARLVPTPFLFSGMLQTIYCSARVLRRDTLSDINYKRETLAMGDGGTVSLDWYPGVPGPDAETMQPIAVVVPGVGGSAYEYHIRALVKHLATGTRSNLRVVVVNHRGSGRTPLTSARLYNAYDTRDVADVLGHLAQRFPRAPLVGVGVSMGGNLLTRYLGEAQERALLTAAVVVSCPFDMELAGRAIDRPGLLNDHLFQRQLVATLKRLLVRHRELLTTTAFDFDAMMRCGRLSEIDTLVTAKLYGFKDCWEYYRAASSGPWVASIRRPFLAINALDDPMAPAAGIPMAAFAANPHTAAALLAHGGHIGFYAGLPPRIWFLEPVAEFLDAVIS